jgi:hypothetical protein
MQNGSGRQRKYWIINPEQQNNMSDILQIVKEFGIDEIPSGFEPAGSGHINDSYRIKISPAGSSGYFLQRINHQIFKDVPLLTDNILKVTKHISEKILSGEPGIPFVGLSLIPARDGQFFHRDNEGNYWRMFNFIEGSRSFDLVPNTGLAYEGGKAFGLFLRLTADLDADSISETIRDFHNIETRMAAFKKTYEKDLCKRAEEAKNEIRFIEERSAEMHKILKLGLSGLIPLRVTHNDTKFNNILFDEQNKAICIVDLDTVMPGYVLYDFGDAIRTGANTGAEDETDLQKVNINLELFKAYSRGFLESAGGSLTLEEKSHLAFSARFMTFIIGLRFLTDFLAGDTYYKIHFPGHNLQRARAQFKLVQSMEQNAASMERIISDLCKSNS